MFQGLGFRVQGLFGKMSPQLITERKRQLQVQRLPLSQISKADSGEAIWGARARFRAKVDGCVPQTWRVNLRIVC